MAELRYNPLTKDWLMVASHRQARPQMPANWCPFCPSEGNDKVPKEGFGVLRYPNDFPALSSAPPVPDDAGGGIFETAPAYGRCEVLLYSDKHTATLADLSGAHVHKLARMWRDVYVDLAADPKIKYAFIFENRGELVGVTMPHPHGQAYGYPFVPSKIREQLTGAKERHDEKGDCLFCALLGQELKDGRRVVFENEYFAVYVPFFGQTAYGVWITAKRHVANLSQMTDEEIDALGETVKSVSTMYDALFNKPYPYMMCIRNAPTDGSADAYYHFHIEFIALLRSADKQQFFASSESGAGAWCNPTSPEEKAAELREVYGRIAR